MPIILRNIADFSCVSDVVCNTKIMPAQMNDRIEMQRHIASLGQVVAEGNNGLIQGTLIPFNGFAIEGTWGGTRGAGTSGTNFSPVYETSQIFENTKLFSGFTLQAEGKLFKGYYGYTTYFSSIEILIRETQTGYEQRLMRLVPNIYTPGGPLSSTNIWAYQPATGEHVAPFDTPKRIRIVGALNPQLIAPVGYGVGLELVTRISQVGASGGALFRRSDATGAQYWAGLLYYQLKLHHSCQ